MKPFVTSIITSVAALLSLTTAVPTSSPDESNLTISNPFATQSQSVPVWMCSAQNFDSDCLSTRIPINYCQRLAGTKWYHKLGSIAVAPGFKCQITLSPIDNGCKEGGDVTLKGMVSSFDVMGITDKTAAVFCKPCAQHPDGTCA